VRFSLLIPGLQHQAVSGRIVGGELLGVRLIAQDLVVAVTVLALGIELLGVLAALVRIRALLAVVAHDASASMTLAASLARASSSAASRSYRVNPFLPNSSTNRSRVTPTLFNMRSSPTASASWSICSTVMVWCVSTAKPPRSSRTML